MKSTKMKSTAVCITTLAIVFLLKTAGDVTGPQDNDGNDCPQIARIKEYSADNFIYAATYGAAKIGGTGCEVYVFDPSCENSTRRISVPNISLDSTMRILKYPDAICTKKSYWVNPTYGCYDPRTERIEITVNGRFLCYIPTATARLPDIVLKFVLRNNICYSTAP